MALNYMRVGWEDAPSKNTPVDAANLNHMDNGILALSRAYDEDVPRLQGQVADFSSNIPTIVDERMDNKFGNDIGDNVTAWLTEHVTPSGSAVVVDNTLTIEGAAADAKKTGDEISGLKEDLKSVLDTISGNEVIQFTNGYYIATNLTVGDEVNLAPVTGSAINNYAIINVNEGEYITINGTGGNTGRLWCFIDSDSKLISVANVSEQATNKVLQAPPDASKLILNIINTPGVCYKGIELVKKYEKLNKAVENGFGYNPTQLLEKNACMPNARLKFDGTTENFAGTWVSAYIPVEEYKNYYLTFSYYSSKDYGMAFYNSNMDYIPDSSMKQAISSAVPASTPFEFSAPENAKYVRFTITTTAYPYAAMYEMKPVIDGDQKANVNLIKEEYLIDGTRIKTTDGEPEGSPNLSSSGFISVIPGEMYEISFSWFSSGNYGMAFFKDDKTYLSGNKQSVLHESSETKPFRFIAPKDAAYCRITIVNRYSKKELIKVDKNDELFYTIPTLYTFTTKFTETTETTGVDYTLCDVQGGCTHGDYLYYALRFNGQDIDNTMLRRFNLTTGNVDLSAYNHSYGHANSMTYVSSEDKIYVMSSVYDATVSIVDPSDLSYVDSFNLNDIVSSVVETENYRCSNIEYNSELDKIFLFVIEVVDLEHPVQGIWSRTVIVLDTNLNYEKHYKMPVIKGDNTSDTTITKDFIVNAQYDGVTDNNRLAFYNMNGKLIENDILFNPYNEPEFVVFASDGKTYAAFNENNQPKIVKCTPIVTKQIAKVQPIVNFDPV